MELQSRFAFLLQPIRDLTKNWDVDVAAQLEDYLTEIAEITISFDGGSTTMNFAEAALLIQGSTCVYSKKVEYLYALVYQTLDLIASKRKLAQASSVDDQGRDTDTSFMQKRADDELLALDDMAINTNIDLVESTRDSDMKTVSTVPRTPMSLIPLQDSERATSTPLLSRTGELLGSKVDFKMNTGSLHSSGALMLEPMSQLVIEVQLRGKDPVPISYDTPARAISSMLSAGAAGDMSVADATAMDTGGMGEDGAGSDHEAGGLPSPLPSPPPPSNSIRRRSQRSALRKARVQVVDRGRKDPWRPLDPHERVANKHRPFRKGTTHKVPSSLKKSQSRKRKEENTREQPVQPLADCLLKSFYSCSSLFPKGNLKAPMSSEFEGLYWAEQKARKQQRAKDARTLHQLHCDSVEGLQEGEEAETIESYHPLGQEDDIDDGFEHEAGAVEESFKRLPETPHKMTGNISFQGVEPMALDEESWGSNPPPVVQNYEDLVRNYVESTLANAVVYAHETELSRRVTEWEERIKPTLTAEDFHPVFDIHQCGSQILTTFQETGSADLQFHQIVQNKEQYEVCRLFTASLQLANDYNVEISADDVWDEAVGSMRLKLLSTRRPHERMSNYRAPSLSIH